MSIKEVVIKQAQLAKKASRKMAAVSTEQKNQALIRMAEELVAASDTIINENNRDMEAAEQAGLSKALLDRLLLTEKRINEMAQGLKEIAVLDDPIGIIEEMKTRPNGLKIGRMRVPMGVIGIIYEARPNVTVDAAGLCLKSGNSVILRGGSEAIYSNKILAKILSAAASASGLPQGAIQLIQTTDRKAVQLLLNLNQYIDLLIPRGGAELIKMVVARATVPVIETGVGNCHIYVDSGADLQRAVEIIIDAKTSRPAVCNAAESLVIHQDVAAKFIPEISNRLSEKGVEIRGCTHSQSLSEKIKLADEDDWGREYLDYIISVKVVADFEQAVGHINRYGTGHSEAIVTDNYQKSLRFLEEVDAAAVYINASTRFTDGNQFGLGAEIGISTQKMHARGPMGLKELTTGKYIIFGKGQTRK